MPTRRHSRYPAEQWQAWIDEQARSGLSQRIFCEQKSLSKLFPTLETPPDVRNFGDAPVLGCRCGTLCPGIDPRDGVVQ